ncbi:MAG: D-2-hydroxyacid dehydrogenase [Opitutaceae bacterium]|nr:D-2-hydroxyacid dehydrogenase [Opitutaceae bacterium]
MNYTIWCNGAFSEKAMGMLREGLRDHRLILAGKALPTAAGTSVGESKVADADIAFGQPGLEDCLDHRNLKWVALTSAGYTRFDTPVFKEEFRARHAILTNMSAVFADPCAQQALAMILSVARQLLPAHRDQLDGRNWNYAERRHGTVSLTGQKVLLLGFGAIGRRLAELLGPLHMKLYAVRRQVRSERGLTVVPEEQLTGLLPEMDHVVNLLPENDATRNYVNARRLSAFKPGACFYNIGRGTTVDQSALAEALHAGRLAAAYLDVTDPEPLPLSHPLWAAPNCYITPHIAGGRRDEYEAIVSHFLTNLAAFERGGEMADRIV